MTISHTTLAKLKPRDLPLINNNMIGQSYFILEVVNSHIQQAT